jgi:hypothetical protein
VRPREFARQLVRLVSIALTLTLALPVWACGGQTVLSWTPPTRNTDGSPLADLASYRVYWRVGSGTGYPNSLLVPAPASGYTLKGLPNEGTCYFAVTALNAKGVESVYSDEARKSRVSPPGKPSIDIEWREHSVALSKAFAIAAGNGDTGGALTTGTFDSTGFTHLVVGYKHEGATTTLTPSDNKGSTGWNSLTKINHSNGDLSSQMFWVPIGTPGTGHTVTITPAASRPWRTMVVWLVSAGTTVELDAQAGAQSSGSAVDAGSLATTGVSVVSFLFVGPYASGSYTPSAGWTEDHDGAVGSVSSYGASRGPETTTPINPAATWTNTDSWAVVAASLREASGGGGISIAVVQHFRQRVF